MVKRLVVGMSGASGAPLTVELLRQLHDRHPEVETHLIVTRGGEMTLSQETEMTLDELRALACAVHENAAIGASIASGSFRSCTNSRSIQIREPKLPMARRKIAGILCVFQDLSTQPAAIWAAKLGAEAIGTASQDSGYGGGAVQHENGGGRCVRLLGQSVAAGRRCVPEGAAEAGAVRQGKSAVHRSPAQSV